MQAPLSYVIDIVSLLNSFETHVLLTLIWKYLKTILQAQSQPNSVIKPLMIIQHKPIDKSMIDQMRVIFQRNITKLAHLYAKFFKDSINQNKNEIIIS